MQLLAGAGPAGGPVFLLVMLRAEYPVVQSRYIKKRFGDSVQTAHVSVSGIFGRGVLRCVRVSWVCRTTQLSHPPLLGEIGTQIPQDDSQA